MDIFEGLDLLLKKVNESSKKTDSDYLDIPVAKNMRTAGQAINDVREQIIQEILKGEGPEPGGDDSDDPEPPRILPPEPPHVPIKRKRLPSEDGSSDKPKDWEEAEVCWDRDEFLERLEMEAEELKRKEKEEAEKDSKDYDDFLDKESTGEGGESSKSKDGGSGVDEDDSDDEEKYGDDDDEKDSTKSSKKKSKGDKKTSGKDGKDDGDDDDGDDKDGEGSKIIEDGGGYGGKKKSDLEKSIEDAIKSLEDTNEAKKEDLKELVDMLKDDDLDGDEIEEKESEMIGDKSKSREKVDKLKSLVGRLEKVPSKEEIEKEIEASKLSPEEIKAIKDETVEGALSVTPPTDAELERLKREAMVEMEKKCKGHSSIKTSILYHSLKTNKIENEDWNKIVEKILKDRSVNKGELREKTKVVKLGDKNHLWRHDVRYTKTYKKAGSETQSIYCFVDYSGSVSSRPGLIVSFLGKILGICERLEYTDLNVYTFADSLSLPRIINNKMLKDDGYEKVLANTLAYFDLPENYVGGLIEDFSLVALEVNKIKAKDKNAIIFIFGDGYWTFYGNTNPPTKLNEICPHWIKDIIAFVFFDEIDGTLGKEISLLKDVVGIKDVITTKAKAMEEKGLIK